MIAKQIPLRQEHSLRLTKSIYPKTGAQPGGGFGAFPPRNFQNIV